MNFVEQHSNLLFENIQNSPYRDVPGKDKTPIHFDHQAVIRELNQYLLKVKSEPDLFKKICNLLNDSNYIEIVNIFAVRLDGEDVELAAHAGKNESTLNYTRLNPEDSKQDGILAKLAIKNGEPYIFSDIEKETPVIPCKDMLQELGMKSGISLPLIYDENLIGALNLYYDKKDAINQEELDFLNEIAAIAEIGIKTIRLEKSIERSSSESKHMINAIVDALTKTSEVIDPYTSRHEHIVSTIAFNLAYKLDCPADKIQGIYVAGLLHDIGKIIIPDKILYKPKELSDEEYNIIKQHPNISFEILNTIEFPWPVAKTALQHHERINGSGYPNGISGKEIIPEARVLMVADVLEAIASNRPHRPGKGIEKAIEEISNNKNILYDGEVVDVCLALYNERRQVLEHLLAGNF
jgi:putative nucleotidyltransferase with HDIG domain